ncbi:MAG: hypothetical protein AB7R40_23870 [Nitrospiraceae bacterium]
MRRTWAAGSTKYKASGRLFHRGGVAMNLKEKIVALSLARPDLTVAQAAQALIVHPQYVHRIARECGLKFAPASEAAR